ncbi:pleckstrin homology domain-containing family B member 2-like [Tubulanus polymorphus]|uniref:pleckstrin homology domain-containing family B member 2-like n=1 Tax=Tubulanus polymorphus TaxID=672921 RepID=UPI003DA2F663
MSNFEIVKADWLYRQSSILKRWKRKWFVLYGNGELRYFEDQNEYESEETILMTVDVINIKTGLQIQNVTPPEGQNKDSLIQITCKDDGNMNLCADSLDDMSAWQFSLEQARIIYPSNLPPPYQTPNRHGDNQQCAYPRQQYQQVGYPQVVYNAQPPAYGQQVYQTVPGATNVIYVDDRRRYYRDDGTDLAMGVVAGAALTSMMWSPFLFW